jgi:hypothetical protein
MITKYWTNEAAIIKSQVRDLVEIIGDIKEEQVFSAWIFANNMMAVHVVCGELNDTAITRLLPTYASLNMHRTSHYCKEFRFTILMDEWTEGFNLNRQKLTNIKERKQMIHFRK